MSHSIRKRKMNGIWQRKYVLFPQQRYIGCIAAYNNE